jgi:cytoskeletal protein CcmA (bactofilin family)
MSNAKNTVAGKKTLVEEGTAFKGSLSSNCPVEVRGAVDGQLTAPTLTVSSTGSVCGKVKVVDLRSEGQLAGEFEAEFVQLGGSVRDNTVIRAKSLEVKIATTKGAMQVMFGECELDIGNEEAAEATTDPAAKAEPAQEASPEPPAPDGPPPKARPRRSTNTGSVPPGPIGSSN